jgi:hypothetical protein
MSTVLTRFDIYSTESSYYGEPEEDREGDWVRAQDAYDHIAILEAKIRVLETQLKDLKREEK